MTDRERWSAAFDAIGAELARKRQEECDEVVAALKAGNSKLEISRLNRAYDLQPLGLYVGDVLIGSVYVEADDDVLTLGKITLEWRLQRRGLGTAALSLLSQEARNLGMTRIKGELVDRQRIDELERFYRRSGYAVTINSNRTYGRIELKL